MMSLAIQEVSWARLEQKETPQILEIVLDALAAVQAPAPQLTKHNMVYGYLPPAHQEWSEEEKYWSIQYNQEKGQNQGQFLVGKNFKETEEGVIGAKNILLTNACIEVVEKIEEYIAEDETPQEFLVCAVKLSNWDEAKQVIIPLQDYKKAFQIIHRKYPEIQLSIKSPDAMEEYLTAVYTRARDRIPLRVSTRKSGWMDIHGDIAYHIGTDDFYDSCVMPLIDKKNRESIAREGFRFLDISPDNSSIQTLFLFAHMAYSLYWMRLGGADVGTVLFMQGATGSFKTSLARKLANLMEVSGEKSKETLSFMSTWPSVQRAITMLCDAVCVIDDYSNSEEQTSRASLKLAEQIIRAVGDGRFPTKMAMTNANNIFREGIRAAVIFTGEESLALGASSTLRMITVQIERDLIDKDVLGKVSRDSMARYFAMYIAFLTECGTELAESAAKVFEDYRIDYADNLVSQMPRLAETAAGFALQTEWLYQFILWCGYAENKAVDTKRVFLKAIDLVIQKNSKRADHEQPELRFIYALFQRIGSTEKTGIAENETIYAEAESRYIGFYIRNKDQIWLRFDTAYELVAQYYQKLGESWLVKPMTIKQLLLKKGFSIGRVASKGIGAEYLMKSRKGSRKRMLVLKQSIINDILENIEGDD